MSKGKNLNKIVGEIIASKLEEELHKRLQRSGRNLGKLRERTSSLLKTLPASLPAPQDDVIDVEALESEEANSEVPRGSEIRGDDLGDESSGRPLSFRRLPRWNPPPK